MKKFDVDQLVAGILSQDRVLLARAITLVESTNPEHQKLATELLKKLIPHIKPARRIGITGTPGVGKSTFIQSFTSKLSKQNKKVAILAIDPTSVKSGGSILGDKTRMGDLTLDDNVYIRPTPSGLYLGGVAAKTREAVLVCEAFGFEYVLIETVGVGQSEVTVSKMVDCFLMLAQPGAGDELQGIKRGILELVDLVVINKADGDQLNQAKLAKTLLDNALHILRGVDETIPASCLCSSIHSQGLEDVEKLVNDHFAKHDFVKSRKKMNENWFQESLEENLKYKIFNTELVKNKISEINESNKIVPELVNEVLSKISIVD